ncbi:MAG TPA: glycosyltransferase family 39 protein [Candidatus Methylacidiphilales bacterium]|nr:glycosyltransferase family 39 protein [Candidatus Methylacidiphilales bacterium]
MHLNATSSAVSPVSFWKTALLIFFSVLLLALPQAILLPLLDRDEPRFAEASREMLQSGNYIVPAFNHEPRYAKPPLIYWCQTLCYGLFGENEFAARFPSLLATAGTALLLFMWGFRLGDCRIGIIAALAYSFCFQTMQQGRVATADAALIFFMTLTGYTGWKLLHHEPPPKDAPPPHSVFRTGSTLRAWTFRLVVALAAGFLAKGPEAWLPVVALLVYARTWRARAFFFGWFLAGAALVCLWAIPAYIATNGDYWRIGLGENVFHRMISPMQSHGASSLGGYLLSVPLYYPLLFWLSALPLSPLLITHGKKLFGAWRADSVDFYFLFNAGIIFLVFSLMATKLPSYTLPAFPFLVLFFARRWVMVGLSPRLPVRLAAGMGIVLAAVAAVGISPALAAQITPSPVKVLVNEAKDDLTTATKFACVDFQEPNTVWEMRRVTKSYGETISKEEVVSYLLRPGSRAVILTTSLWRQCASDSAGLPAWKTYEARGFNAAKLSRIDLTLVVKGS